MRGILQMSGRYDGMTKITNEGPPRLDDADARKARHAPADKDKVGNVRKENEARSELISGTNGLL
jgi:hypothetical protein